LKVILSQKLHFDKILHDFEQNKNDIEIENKPPEFFLDKLVFILVICRH